MTSTQLSRKHFILIGVAAFCLLLAGSVFVIFRQFSTPKINVMADRRRMELRERQRKAGALPLDKEGEYVPSKEMKKFLDHMRMKQADLKDLKYSQILVEGLFDPQAEDFRTKFMMNMDEKDYSYLIIAYARSIAFLPDDEFLASAQQMAHMSAQERLEKHIIPSTIKKFEKLVIQQGGPPSFLGSSAVYKVKPEIYDASEYKEHAKVELAGMKKGEKEIEVVPQKTGVRSIHMFGDDAAGVSASSHYFALSDGVSSASKSQCTAQAAVELAIELLEQNPSASLATHSLCLLDSIVRFLRLFKMDGKGTLTVAQLDGHDLTVLNIGDSGCAVVDSTNRVLMMTPIGEHEPNTPFQVPSSIENDIRRAQLFKFSVPSGSRVIIYSDGISDNLWPNNIAQLKYAGEIAASALHIIKVANISDIPITAHLRAKGEKVFGKNDDISVIVCRV